jgi:hypothetical protein
LLACSCGGGCGELGVRGGVVADAGDGEFGDDESGVVVGVVVVPAAAGVVPNGLVLRRTSWLEAVDL